MSTSRARPTTPARRPDAVSGAVVVAHLALVISPVYVAAVRGPGWYLLLLTVALGLGMNSVLNLMHEAAHALVFSRRSMSDLLGRWVLGPMLFADFDAYKIRHWDHHRFLGVDGETKDTYAVDIRGWRVMSVLLSCLSTATAIAKFRRQTANTEAGPPNRAWLGRLFAWHTAIGTSVLLCAWLANPRQGFGPAMISAGLAYLVVYLYGLMGVTVFMATLRAIAEHQPYTSDESMRGRAALRNFTCGPVSRCLMGAYGFGEHYTHHKEPGIPYYQLVAATDRMAEADSTLRQGKGYFRVLGEIITGAASPRTAPHD